MLGFECISHEEKVHRSTESHVLPNVLHELVGIVMMCRSALRKRDLSRSVSFAARNLVELHIVRLLRKLLDCCKIDSNS